MADIQGQVRNSSAKPFKGAQGQITLYSFRLEGDNRWFGCGTDQPNCADGDTISFSYEDKNGKQKVNVNSIKKVEGAKAEASTQVATGANQGYASRQAMFAAKDAYWDSKAKRDIEVVEPRINFSASQRDAVALVTAALAHDCLSFGTTAKGKKLDMLLEFVDQVTDRFVAQREGTAKGDK